MNVKALLKKHEKTREVILDQFSKVKMSHEEGEAILLFLAGMSAGIRDQPVAGELAVSWIEPLAIGWKLGVQHACDD